MQINLQIHIIKNDFEEMKRKKIINNNFSNQLYIFIFHGVCINFFINYYCTSKRLNFQIL